MSANTRQGSPVVVNRNVIFIVIAIVCFTVGFFLAAGLLSGGHVLAWAMAGFIAFAAGHLP